MFLPTHWEFLTILTCIYNYILLRLEGHNADCCLFESTKQSGTQGRVQCSAIETMVLLLIVDFMGQHTIFY